MTFLSRRHHPRLFLVPVAGGRQSAILGALGGMCWTHALTQLLRTHSIPGTLPEGRRFLVVVERKSEALFVRLSELLLDEPRIQVLLDRRQRERRQRDLSTLRDRRRGDR